MNYIYSLKPIQVICLSKEITSENQSKSLIFDSYYISRIQGPKIIIEMTPQLGC